MALSKFSKSMIGLPPMVRENPLFPSFPRENPEESADKTEFIRLEFFMNRNNPATNYARHLSYSRMDVQKTG
jgi:hypothetical protein